MPMLKVWHFGDLVNVRFVEHDGRTFLFRSMTPPRPEDFDYDATLIEVDAWGYQVLDENRGTPKDAPL